MSAKSLRTRIAEQPKTIRRVLVANGLPGNDEMVRLVLKRCWEVNVDAFRVALERQLAGVGR